MRKRLSSLGHAPNPHWIHIGFAKTGSTYLQRWFDDHPQIAYRPGGIAGQYNIHDLVSESQFQSDEFRCRITSCEQIASPPFQQSDASAGPELQSYDPEASMISCNTTCNLLSDLFPNAHILVVTRGFRSIIRSSYSEMIRQGAGVLPHEMLETINQFDIREIFRFDYIIDLYRDRFSNRVLALPYELLLEDRREFLNIIETSMGVDQFDIGGELINPSLSASELYWYPRFARIIRKCPTGRIRGRLIKLHRTMIARGFWKPIIRIIEHFVGAREAIFDTSDASLADYTGVSSKLADNPYHTRFRSEYTIEAPAV